MTSTHSSAQSGRLTRRTMVQGAAWSAPAIAMAASAPAIAASRPEDHIIPGPNPGTYRVKIPAGVKYVDYDIGGGRGGGAGVTAGIGMRLRGRLNLEGRGDQPTYLVIKVGSMGLNRGQWADDNYRRGASLGGFGGRRKYPNEPAVKVDGGDGGGSTAIFIGRSETDDSGDFSRAVVLAAGGAGAGNWQNTVLPGTTATDFVLVSNNDAPWAGHAQDGKNPWGNVTSGPQSGKLVRGEDSKPIVPRNKSTNEPYFTMPSAVNNLGLSSGVNNWTNPGNVFGDEKVDANGQGPTFGPYLGDSGLTASAGGHGGNAQFLYGPDGAIINYGMGAGGGGGGWVGGAAGNSWRMTAELWNRGFGTSGAPGSSFYTENTVDGVKHMNNNVNGSVAPQRNLNDDVNVANAGKSEWGQGYFVLRYTGLDPEVNYDPSK